MKTQLSVIGGRDAGGDELAQAYEVGRLAAARDWILLSGGMGGVMEAASRGAAEAGGLVVAILPGYDRKTANPYAAVIIPTGLGYARNTLVAAAADGVVAVGGRYGTLSEIALALQLGKPVVGLNTWPGIEGVWPAADAAAAVDKLAALIV